jgi:hypothetical protein
LVVAWETLALKDAAHPLFHANQRQGIGGTSTSMGNDDKRQVPTPRGHFAPDFYIC